MKQNKVFDVLSQHQFFKGMEPSQLEVLSRGATNKSYGAGRYLAYEGERAEFFFLLLEGKVEILIDGGRGKQTLQTLGPGEIFGWSWIFPPYRWSFDARAVEPVKVLALAGKTLRQRCEQDPALGYQLMKRFARIMVARLRATRLQVLDVYGLEQEKC